MSFQGIHWFRRDLRLTGNVALNENLARSAGRVLGIFIIDRKFLSRDDFCKSRFAHFLDTLLVLRNSLRQKGGELVVFDSSPETVLVETSKFLLAKNPNTKVSISWNRDYEPFARARDQKITNILTACSEVSLHTQRDHLIIEPEELQKPKTGKTNSFYSVFTPFAKKWSSLMGEKEFENRIHQSLSSHELDNSQIDATWVRENKFLPGSQENLLSELRNEIKTSVPIPGAGADFAWSQWLSFARKINSYETERDFPSIEATSKISYYLKNGSITTSRLIANLDLKNPKTTPFIRQLIWREFYYHILWHNPNVETEAYLPDFRNLHWENDNAKWEAWTSGQTGFPIIDAAMRCLLETGTMHNRLRMIVASFLVKDLHIDWRLGEQWFMQNLLDGDLAANNGGWQWAASTGCDAQPYFRIFNPVTQSRKFDAEGFFLRKYLPELRRLSNKEIHDPPKIFAYPTPIINHAAARQETLRMYSNKKRSAPKISS